jgi:hypothetical protein
MASAVWAVLAACLFSLPHDATAGTRIWVPIRWCGVQGAPSMDNPAAVNEATTDNVLWRRHERPTDAIYHDFVDMTFRAGATAEIKNGPMSFPIIADPSGTGGNLVESAENNDAVTMCRRAWTLGDPLYFEQSNNGTVNAGQDTLLSTDVPVDGFVDLGHDGLALHAVPGGVRFVDLDGNGSFDIGERIYRDENTDNTVDAGDTLLTGTLATVVGNINAADTGEALLPLPSRVKYADLIHEPANTFNIGYPSVQGITSVNANDVEFTSIAFPVHGIAISGLGGLGVAVDDASQYLPPGPDYTLFETQLVGHEFGHSMTLPHGDGIDDDMNGILDDADDPAAPVPGAGPGTLCDSNNMMSYCWLDSGTSGAPNLSFIGVGAPTYGIMTAAQADQVRNFVLANVSDRVVDPVTPPLVASHVDSIGELKPPFEHLDIADIAVRVDDKRENAMFELVTRRPIAPKSRAEMDFHFLLDLDANSKTGGSKPALAAIGVPSTFPGAEYVGRVRLQGRKVTAFTLFRFDEEAGKYLPIDDERIRAFRETIKAIPDFPMGRAHDPDTPPQSVYDLPVKEVIVMAVPVSLMPVQQNSRFAIEYVARDVASGTLDRARTYGMDFRLPVFPECRTEPENVPRGGSTQVISSGLLPNREVHLLLGPEEVAHGTTDASGKVTIEMPIPADAKTGQRLVTVGAAAVSADCSVTVEKPPAGQPGDGGGKPGTLTQCCERLSLQLWIIIAVMVIGFIGVLILLRKG